MRNALILTAGLTLAGFSACDRGGDHGAMAAYEEITVRGTERMLDALASFQVGVGGRIL